MSKHVAFHTSRRATVARSTRRTRGSFCAISRTTVRSAIRRAVIQDDDFEMERPCLLSIEHRARLTFRSSLRAGMSTEQLGQSGSAAWEAVCRAPGCERTTLPGQWPRQSGAGGDVNNYPFRRPVDVLARSSLSAHASTQHTPCIIGGSSRRERLFRLQAQSARSRRQDRVASSSCACSRAPAETDLSTRRRTRRGSLLGVAASPKDTRISGCGSVQNVVLDGQRQENCLRCFTLRERTDAAPKTERTLPQHP